MSLRRLVPLLVLIALALAPFGRIGMAKAIMAPHHGAAMAAHCAGAPASNDDEGGRVSIDCMMACAAMTAPGASEPAHPAFAGLDAAATALPALSGIQPQAEPPPPRLA